MRCDLSYGTKCHSGAEVDLVGGAPGPSRFCPHDFAYPPTPDATRGNALEEHLLATRDQKRQADKQEEEKKREAARSGQARRREEPRS